MTNRLYKYALKNATKNPQPTAVFFRQRQKSRTADCGDAFCLSVHSTLYIVEWNRKTKHLLRKTQTNNQITSDYTNSSTFLKIQAQQLILQPIPEMQETPSNIAAPLGFKPRFSVLRCTQKKSNNPKIFRNFAFNFKLVYIVNKVAFAT